MKIIRARKVFPYAGRMIPAGERFEATDKDADLLIAIGQAETVIEADDGDFDEDDDEQEAGLYMTQTIKRRQGQRGPDKKPRKKRGTYSRRDMRAEK